jgi:hypothetical protein
MYLSEMDRTIPQSNTRDPFALAPSPASIGFPQPCELADSRSCGERLDLRNLAENLEVEAAIGRRYSITSSTSC